MVLVAGLLAACSGDGEEAPAATVPRPTTTTTTPLSEVPARIDVAYVQRVMNELDRVLGDALRVLVAKKGPSQEFVDLLRAVYDEPEYSRADASFRSEAASGFETFRDPPGSPTTRVERIIKASSECVFF